MFNCPRFLKSTNVIDVAFKVQIMQPEIYIGVRFLKSTPLLNVTFEFKSSHFENGTWNTAIFASLHGIFFVGYLFYLFY